MAARLLPRRARVAIPALRPQCTSKCQLRYISYSLSVSCPENSRSALIDPGMKLQDEIRPRPQSTSTPSPGATNRFKAGVKENMAEWNQELGLFYNNDFRASESGLTIPVYDPTDSRATDPKVIAEVSCPSDKDIDSIVNGAQAALGGPWKDYTGTQRGQLLNKLADLIEEHSHTLATIETLDSGKAFTVSSSWDVPHTAEVFRYYASLAPSTADEKIDRGDGQWVEVIKSPVGVVGAIIPWNYPLAMAAWKLAPALAAGCTIVLKTSDLTPLSMLYVADLIRKAGFPPGVVNIITGGGNVGAALVRHPSISKIAFTGSTAVGKAIRVAASQQLKPVTLETGGKSPLIIFDDADLHEAVKHAHEGVFSNQGQVCTATSRILVHHSVHDEFLNKFKLYTEKTSVVGRPFDEDTYQGPQISAEHLARIQRIIDFARHQQLDDIAGTKIWQPKDIKLPERGFFMAPTIVSNLKPNNRLWREEIFGPVACVMGFETDAEALKLANDTEYGLAGAIFTRNSSRKRNMALGLHAGTVWVGSNQDCDLRVPFGGWKESGIGRELGPDGLEMYLAKKVIYWSDGIP